MIGSLQRAAWQSYCCERHSWDRESQEESRQYQLGKLSESFCHLDFKSLWEYNKDMIFHLDLMYQMSPTASTEWIFFFTLWVHALHIWQLKYSDFSDYSCKKNEWLCWHQYF